MAAALAAGFGMAGCTPAPDLATTTTLPADRCQQREPGAVLAGCDLAGADLSGADLRGANLTDADLTAANLTDVRLFGALIAGAEFAGSTTVGLRSGSLIGTPDSLPVERAALKNGHILAPGVDLSSLTWPDRGDAVSGFAGNLGNLDLAGANLSESVFNSTDLSSTSLRGADLTDTSFAGSLFSGNDLTDANLTRTNFTGISPVDFASNVFTGATWVDTTCPTGSVQSSPCV